jgi:hypothetical protein
VLEKTINKQIELNKLSLTKGWKGADWVRAIARDFWANYIVLNKWQDRQLIKDLLAKWFALTIGIKLDIDYVLDGRDGILNETWKKYVDGKTYWHFTTIIWSNDDVVKLEWWYKYAVLDSYAYRKKWEWLYKFNDIDWLLDYIVFPTVYLIF